MKKAEYNISTGSMQLSSQFHVTLTSKAKCHSPHFILTLCCFTFACSFVHPDFKNTDLESCATCNYFTGLTIAMILLLFSHLYYQDADSSIWFKGHSCACFIGPGTMPFSSVFLWLSQTSTRDCLSGYFLPVSSPDEHIGQLQVTKHLTS